MLQLGGMQFKANRVCLEAVLVWWLTGMEVHALMQK
jgi:hypothetical protein